MSVKIALLGFGTVASGVPFLLKENKEKILQSAQSEIEVAKVLVKDDAEKDRLLAAGNDFDFVTNVDEILEDSDIAIVVELMGRIEPAKTFITRALQAGKHVVTANKDLLAVHGAELIAIAKEHGVALYYEAAVAGGIPILRTLVNSLAADKVTRVLGVVNGTSNFMMTKMVEEGWSYEDALAKAQELGYAESDPTNDVDGIDAAYKMVILSQFAFGMDVQFDQVGHKGIRKITPQDVAVAQSFQRLNIPLHKLSCHQTLTFINHRTYAVMRGGAISFAVHRRCCIYLLLIHSDIFFMRPKIGVC